MSKAQQSAPANPKGEDEYRAKDDARTLSEAEAIRADGRRMSAARRHLEHSVRALRKTQDGKRQRKRNRR